MALPQTYMREKKNTDNYPLLNAYYVLGIKLIWVNYYFI